MEREPEPAAAAASQGTGGDEGGSQTVEEETPSQEAPILPHMQPSSLPVLNMDALEAFNAAKNPMWVTTFAPNKFRLNCLLLGKVLLQKV